MVLYVKLVSTRLAPEASTVTEWDVLCDPHFPIVLINFINLTWQIKNGNDVVRERAIKYLHLKLKTEGGQLLNKEAEVTLFKEIKGCVMVSVVKRMQYSTSRHSAKIYGHPCKYPIPWRLPFITVNPVSISGNTV